MSKRCETCGADATQWDYDQHMHFCDRCVQQPEFTVPLDPFARPHPAPGAKPEGKR